MATVNTVTAKWGISFTESADHLWKPQTLPAWTASFARVKSRLPKYLIVQINDSNTIAFKALFSYPTGDVVSYVAVFFSFFAMSRNTTGALHYILRNGCQGEYG